MAPSNSVPRPVLIVWAERFPDNSLANIGGNKQTDTGAESIALLQKLVEKKNNQTGDKELDNDQQANSHAHLARDTVHTGHNVDNSLTNSDDHTKEFLSSRK